MIDATIQQRCERLGTKDYEEARKLLMPEAETNSLVCAALGWSFSDECIGSIGKPLSDYYYGLVDVSSLKSKLCVVAKFLLAKMYDKGLGNAEINKEKAYFLYTVTA